MPILKCLRLAVLCGLFVTGSAMAAGAACSEISDPPASAGLERVKTSISEGRFDDAFERFDIEDDAKRRLAEGIRAVVPDGDMDCITIKRARQGPRFISEVFKTEVGGVILYWTISGEVDGQSFRMINFTYSDKFENIRELIY